MPADAECGPHAVENCMRASAFMHLRRSQSLHLISIAAGARWSSMTFTDRADAGQRLGAVLKEHGIAEGVVLGIPRGGVVTARAVADVLELPLSVMVVRKVGHPHHEEYAICAVTEYGEIMCNESEREQLGMGVIETIAVKAQREARLLRERLAPGGITSLIYEKQAIIVDDGAATGLTLALAAKEAARLGAARVVAAVPVASPDAIGIVSEYADHLVVLDDPELFEGSVGAHYIEFPQLTDEEVEELLDTGVKS